MDLRDRVVLITGARRIGATVASELAKRGADIALSYNRSKDEAEATAEAVRAAGRRAVVWQADLSVPRDCEALVAATVADLGRLDVLVSMASVYRAVPFDQLTVDTLQASLDVDLKSAFACAKAVVPHMRAAGGGRIVNFADWLVVSQRPRYKGYLAYYVAKKAVMGLTEALALELAEDQILVNAIAPGPILAPPELADDELEAVEKATPLGRWGGGEAIAKAVLALIDNDFITGETIRVDGGRHVR
ncbi:MAG TPA: SDR family oxidoreductase [Vicinamibacterales bacterium]|jgi:NAD(P)-dependent dehydrogenase (short-subunit alcohol dehydrogenase family)